MSQITWKAVKAYSDILYHKADGIAKITINRPAKRNAFRPETVAQMHEAFSDARDDASIGVVLLTGAPWLAADPRSASRAACQEPAVADEALR